MLRCTVKPTLMFIWFGFLSQPLVALFPSVVAMLFPNEFTSLVPGKSIFIFGGNTWFCLHLFCKDGWVCARLKSKAQALIRHQFDCFSCKDKVDSNWAWSESFWSVWQGVSMISLNITINLQSYITSEMSCQLQTVRSD